MQRIGPHRTAVQNVGGAIAGEDVVQSVAGAVDRRVPVSVRFSMLPMAWTASSKAEADRRLNQVGAVAAGLVDHVARIVDHIGVVAHAADGASCPHQHRHSGCWRRYCR